MDMGNPVRRIAQSFQSGGIVASKFTKGQCGSPDDYWAWRLSGNGWGIPQTNASACPRPPHGLCVRKEMALRPRLQPLVVAFCMVSHTPPPCTYLLHHLVCQDEEPLGEG